MATDKTDRRVRKTRALLQKSLIQLMEQKEIKDISVKELATLADINRGTFYLHYTDIYDMLHKIEDELFVEFNEILERNLEEGNPEAAANKDVLFDVFSFLERHHDIARVMIGPHGDLAFVNGLKNLVKDRLEHLFSGSNIQDGYYYAFLVSGYVGIIETWLKSENPVPANDMAELCSHMLKIIQY